MKLNPLATNIVAKLEKPAEKTASGILLASKKEETVYAVVESVGKDVKNVKKGDKIVYKEYSTTSVKLESEDYVIVEEKDVLATM